MIHPRRIRKGYNPPPMSRLSSLFRVAAAAALALAGARTAAAAGAAPAGPPAVAEDETAAAEGSSRPPLWVPREWALSAGVFDLAEGDRSEAGVEARFEPVGFRLLGRDWALEPGLGALGIEGDGFYGYFSLRVPVELGERWRAVPFTGAGVYSAGEGKDLGGPVEFRSGLEVSLAVGERWRVGVVYSHLSNAVLYDLNPGAESLVVAVTFRP
jgi:hypothetical protein